MTEYVFCDWPSCAATVETFHESGYCPEHEAGENLGVHEHRMDCPCDKRYCEACGKRKQAHLYGMCPR